MLGAVKGQTVYTTTSDVCNLDHYEEATSGTAATMQDLDAFKILEQARL